MHSIQALILEISADKNRPQRKSLSCGLFYCANLHAFTPKFSFIRLTEAVYTSRIIDKYTREWGIIYG